MSAVFRKKGQQAIEVSQSWELETAIADVSRWLRESSKAMSVRGWVLDIGFNSRLDSVAVQGETVSVAFMRQLVDHDIDLWLSLYPPVESQILE